MHLTPTPWPGPNADPIVRRLAFPGVRGVIAVPAGLGIIQRLTSCLTGWTPVERDDPLQPTLAAVEPEGDGRFTVASHYLPTGLPGLGVAGTVTALIADLTQAFVEAAPGRTSLDCAAVRFANGPLVLLTAASVTDRSAVIARLALPSDAVIFCDTILPVEPGPNGTPTGIALGVAPRLTQPLPAYLTRCAQAPHGTRAPLGTLIDLIRTPGPARLHRTTSTAAISRAHQPCAGRHGDTFDDLTCLTLAHNDPDDAAAVLRQAFAQGDLDPSIPLHDPLQQLPAAEDTEITGPFRRVPGVTLRHYGDGLFLWALDRPTLWHLDPLARATWSLLDQPTTPDEAIEILTPVFPAVTRRLVTEGVRQFLAFALSRGLVEPA